jgi:hypothetical protein
MKRHARTPLQRQRVEFEGASEWNPPWHDDRSTPVVEVKDGYDWLQVIRQAAELRARTH